MSSRRRASLRRFFSGALLVARFRRYALNSTPGLCPMNPTRTYRIFIILLAANALCVFVIGPLALLAGVGVMGGPRADEKLWAWGLLVLALWIPGCFIAGAGLGWVLHERGWIRTSLAVAAAPLVGGVAVAIVAVSEGLESDDDLLFPTLVTIEVALALLFIGALVASHIKSRA